MVASRCSSAVNALDEYYLCTYGDKSSDVSFRRLAVAGFKPSFNAARLGRMGRKCIHDLAL